MFYIKVTLNNFHKHYPYILYNDLIDWFSIFGGLEDNLDLNLISSIDEAIVELIDKIDIDSTFPFFIFDEPFRKFLIAIAKSDGKMNSIFNKIGVGESLGEELVKELIDSKIIYLFDSRESPIKLYPKQLIKKELRDYVIQPKLYFTKPFYRFWFGFVEPNRDKLGFINKTSVLQSFKKYGYRLSSLVFEQLSIELLKIKAKELNINLNICGSYWDRFSEFDIYCNSFEGINIVGECKYTNRKVTKAELVKLESKIEQSALKADYIVLFSKSGYSYELQKQKSNKLLMFSLEDFRELLL